MGVTFKRLEQVDAGLLDRVAPDVFDKPVDTHLVREFLNDPRHHLVVAVAEDGRVIGMASGVHYVHPDKRAQMFINEVGVCTQFRQQGVGRGMLKLLLSRARAMACTEAWVLTSPSNTAAQALYTSSGGVPDAVPSVLFSFPLTQSASG